MQFIRRIFQSRFFLILLLIITAISFVRLMNEVMWRQKIGGRISGLKNDIHTLSEEQHRLSSLIEYLSTDTYIEEEARKQLNLRKPGEQVTVIAPQSSSLTTTTARRSTVSLWWDYFFTRNK